MLGEGLLQADQVESQEKKGGCHELEKVHRNRHRHSAGVGHRGVGGIVTDNL
jgi:hypothetical protein